MQPLGSELKRLRAAKSWTQAYAAREIGIQQSYLSKLENGQFLPSEEVIDKLSSCYGASLQHCLPLSVTKPQRIYRHYVVAALCMMLALTLGLFAEFEIVYPETYFTYQTKSELFWAVNVTPHYRGERFIEGDVIYEIIGERRVSQYQNRILNVVALLLACASGAMVWYLRFLKRTRD